MRTAAPDGNEKRTQYKSGEQALRLMYPIIYQPRLEGFLRLNLTR